VIPIRSRELEAGVLVPFRRVRVSHQALASLVRTDDRYELVSQRVTLNRTAARVGWTTSSAKVFGFSISPERGVTVGGTGESVVDALGSSASASTVTGDLRAYLPGAGANHVVALRAAAGASSGDRAARRVFLLGGTSPAGGVLDFDNDAISLLRGFASNAFAGSRVALLNAEYRWPLARPERGFRTWPVFLHTAHAAVFGDAGHAWSNEFRLGDLKTSLGGELSADVVLGYSLRLTVTAGAAWGHDAQRHSDHATAYLRVGRAF
jgi:hemolysin activation/secretion protein